AMEKRHGARHHGPAAGRESAALDEIVSFAELLEEPADLEEVVGVVGVAHDHIPAARRGDTPDQRVAIAFGRHADDPDAGVPGALARPVGRAVVGDDDLAIDPVLAEGTLSFIQTG